MKKLFTLLFSLALCVVPIAAQAAHTVTLTWTDADTGVTFNVYKATAACSTSPSFTLLNTSAVTTLTYADSTVGVGKFCYYVTAVDTASTLESLPSNTADAKVLPHSPVLGTATVSKLMGLPVGIPIDIEIGQ